MNYIKEEVEKDKKTLKLKYIRCDKCHKKIPNESFYIDYGSYRNGYDCTEDSGQFCKECGAEYIYDFMKKMLGDEEINISYRYFRENTDFSTVTSLGYCFVKNDSYEKERVNNGK